MSPEYKQILDNADKLQAEFKLQPCHLERYLFCMREGGGGGEGRGGGRGSCGEGLSPVCILCINKS